MLIINVFNGMQTGNYTHALLDHIIIVTLRQITIEIEIKT